MQITEISNFAASGVLALAALERAVKRTSKIVENRVSVPILANLHLVGTGESLVITSTDLDMWHTVTIPGAVDSRFNVTVPAKTFSKIVGNQFCESVTARHTATITPPPEDRPEAGEKIETSDVKFDFGGAEFSLHTLSPSDFPSPEELEPLRAFEIGTADLVDALLSTQFAISTEETRYYLNGILMHVETYPERRLVFVATDGHRMARASLAVPDGLEDMPEGVGIILPRRAVATLLGELKAKGAPERVKIEFNTARVRFSYGDAVLLSKIVDGTFPDYGRVIPCHNQKHALVNTKEAIDAIDAVSVISSERGRAVRFSIDGTGNATFTVNNPDAGSAKKNVKLPLYIGEPLDIGFNSKYLTDILAECRVDEVEVQFEDPGSPTRFESKFGNIRWTGVLMPMRV